MLVRYMYLLYAVLCYVGEIHVSPIHVMLCWWDTCTSPVHCTMLCWLDTCISYTLYYAMLVRYMYLLYTVLCYVGEIHVSPVHCLMLCWWDTCISYTLYYAMLVRCMYLIYTVLCYVGEIHVSPIHCTMLCWWDTCISYTRYAMLVRYMYISCTLYYAMLVRYMYLLYTVLCYVGEIHVSPIHCVMLCWWNTLFKKSNATRFWSIKFLLFWIFIHQVRYP